MKYTFEKLIIETLKKAKKPLSVSEIWNKAKTDGYSEQLSSVGKTPTDTIRSILYVDLKEKKKIQNL